MADMLEDRTLLKMIYLDKVADQKLMVMNSKLELCRWKGFKYYPTNIFTSTTQYFNFDVKNVLWIVAVESKEIDKRVMQEAEMLGVKNLIHY